MRTLASVIVLVVCACGGDDDDGGSGGFCDHLDGSPRCGGEQSACEGYLAAEQNQYPVCVEQQSAMLDCLDGLSLTCEPGSDFNVYAQGDGSPEGDEIAFLGNYRLVVRDAACRELGQAYESCKSCGMNVGFGMDKGGIGDPCATASECADGLRCEGGGCTRDCSSDAECLPKHGKGECTTSTGRILICEANVCTTYCRGVGYETYACPPS
jgi:hypothetical protein